MTTTQAAQPSYDDNNNNNGYNNNMMRPPPSEPVQEDEMDVDPRLKRKLKLMNKSGTSINIYHFLPLTGELQLLTENVPSEKSITFESSIGQLFGIRSGNNCNNRYDFEQDKHEKTCPIQYFSISEQDQQVVTAYMSKNDKLRVKFWDNGIQRNRDSGDPSRICLGNMKARMHSMKQSTEAYNTVVSKLIECDLHTNQTVALQRLKQQEEESERHNQMKFNGGFCDSITTKVGHGNYFGGEQYLKPGLLPDYETERSRLTIELVVSVLIVWGTLYMLHFGNSSRKKNNTKDLMMIDIDGNDEEPPSLVNVVSIDVRNNNKSGTTKNRKNNRKNGGNKSSSLGTPTTTSNASKRNRDGKKRSTNNKSKDGNKKQQTSGSYISYGVNISCFVLECLILGLITAFVILTFQSSPGLLTGRGVFQVPVLTKAETQYLLSIVNQVASRNYAGVWKGGVAINNIPILWEPYGWQKLRHGQYPTTDLGAGDDPFMKQELEWINQILNRRLAPVVARIYGIPEHALVANDIFFVRYDDQQALLERHEDASDVSFNILLTEDFDGGGTKFYNRGTNTSFTYVQPDHAGTALIHRGRVNHEGVDVSRGIRIILVGFLWSNTRHPSTKDSWGVSAYASWLDLTWVTTYLKRTSTFIKRKRGVEKNKRLLGVMDYVTKKLEFALDRILEHHDVTLLSDMQDKDEYLRALDCAYEKREREDAQRLYPMWYDFMGEHVL